MSRKAAKKNGADETTLKRMEIRYYVENQALAFEAFDRAVEALELVRPFLDGPQLVHLDKMIAEEIQEERAKWSRTEF